MARKQMTAEDKRRKERADRANRRWTKGEEAQLTRRVRQGMFIEDIAREHKRSRQGIEARVVKLGIGPVRKSPVGNATGPEVKRTGPEVKGTRPVAPKQGLFKRLFSR